MDCPFLTFIVLQNPYMSYMKVQTKFRRKNEKMWIPAHLSTNYRSRSKSYLKINAFAIKK